MKGRKCNKEPKDFFLSFVALSNNSNLYIRVGGLYQPVYKILHEALFSSVRPVTVTHFNAANCYLNNNVYYFETSALIVVWGNNFRDINPFLHILK